MYLPLILGEPLTDLTHVGVIKAHLYLNSELSANILNNFLRSRPENDSILE